MIIGIDGNEANVENKVGIGEYAFELLKQFEKYQISSIRQVFDSEVQTRGTQDKNIKYQIYLKNEPREDLPKEREGWRYRIVHPRKLWTQIGLPFNLYLHKPRPDVFFTPTHYAPRFSPVPTVISIMDLSYIHFPQMFRQKDLYQLRNWTSYSVKKAKKILTISKASKDDIIKIYQIPEEKVVVTYPGIKLKTTMQNSKLIREKYNIRRDYILFVGTLQPRKNITRLIEAFSKLSHTKKSEGMSLVIIGKKGWMYEEILKAPETFGIKDKVKFLDFVPDEDLPSFYQNALCFVLPSLYEGFGLPVLEAMQHGCSVITSNVSSLLEAGGDAALYVKPDDVDDIASKIKTLIEDKKLREELIKKGYNQIKKFSWEKTAKETLEVLEEVVKTK